MIRPKAIVFDLGKVLVDFDYGITVRRLLSRCRVTAAELQRLIDQSPLLHHYESGRLTTEQFFTAVRSATGFDADLASFSEMFGDIFFPIPPMIELHTELRRRGLPTYIFSNTNELAIQDIRRRHAFFQHFTGYILSFEHQAMKPEAKLYQVVERVSGLQGADLLYLDDRKENVVSGAARGWQVILHESPAKTREVFQKMRLVS